MWRGIGGRCRLQHSVGWNRSCLVGGEKALLDDDSRCNPLIGVLNQLDQQGTAIDNATYASLVRWCRDKKALSDGRLVHAHISSSGRDRNTFLANLLLQMYGNCGKVENARSMFNKISQPDIFSWNFMIAAYAQNGHEAEALQLYKNSQMEGVKPNKFTFFPILFAAASLRALREGKQIHERIVDCGFESDVAVRTALLNMYGKCGVLKDARAVFDEVRQRDVILWNAMITAYAQNGLGKEALELFRQMHLEGMTPDRVTFLSILDACTSLASLENGRGIRECIVASGFESDVAVSTALVTMYGKCGALMDARAVFDMMRDRNVISWTAMIAAYAKNGCGTEALELYRQMELEGVKPDNITFLSALEACSSLAALENGRAIHNCVISSGFGSNFVVRNALINMYGKCGAPKDACLVFDQMHERDVISWNAMIAAYAENGHSMEALDLFREMNLEGVMPDRITFLSALDACASLPSLEKGRAIHECLVASGFESDVVVRNALVNMYGKCGVPKDAQVVFNKTHDRNVISWTAMISAYAQNGFAKEALKLFRQMDLEGVKPDRITFLSTLDACARLASVENGRVIHEHIVASGFELDVAVSNALVNMYGKCGAWKDAQLVFDEMHERDVVSWNAMIAAYAQSGHGKDALELFKQMDLEGVKPNRTTFLGMFNACSHAGFFDVGWWYFVSMSGDYGIKPSEEHYVCMGDLLGRAGCLDEAEDLIANMPIRPNVVAWTTLLGACRTYGDVDRGARAAKHVVELDPESDSPYVLLSNIYAAAGMWGDASKENRSMEERG